MACLEFTGLEFTGSVEMYLLTSEQLRSPFGPVLATLLQSPVKTFRPLTGHGSGLVVTI